MLDWPGNSDGVCKPNLNNGVTIRNARCYLGDHMCDLRREYVDISIRNTVARREYDNEKQTRETFHVFLPQSIVAKRQ